MVRSSSLIASLLLPAVLVFAGCGEDTSSYAFGLTFDPCQPLTIVAGPEATQAERDGIAAALPLWNDLAGTHLELADAGGGTGASGTPALPLVFQTAGPPFHGLYDDKRGEIFINQDLSDHSLQVTIAHEIGHAFGLLHISGRPSVMNSGNLSIDPNAGDAALLTDRWGACGL